MFSVVDCVPVSGEKLWLGIGGGVQVFVVDTGSCVWARLGLGLLVSSYLGIRPFKR